MIIEIDRFRLRPLDEKDIESLYSFRNSESVIRSLGGFSTGYSRAALGKWLQFHDGRDDEVLWCLAEKESDRCFGHIGLYNIDHRVRKAELAIAIGDPGMQGKGVGKESCRIMLDYASEQLNLRRVELSYLANNAAAEKLYQGLGFIEEGRLIEAQFRDGGYVDVVLMAKFLDGNRDA